MRHRLPKNERDHRLIIHDHDGHTNSKELTPLQLQQSEDCESTVVEPDLTNGLISRFNDSDDEFDEDDTEEEDDDEENNINQLTEIRPDISNPLPIDLMELRRLLMGENNDDHHINNFRRELPNSSSTNRKTTIMRASRKGIHNIPKKSIPKDSLALTTYPLSSPNYTTAASFMDEGGSNGQLKTNHYEESAFSIRQKRRASLSPSLLSADPGRLLSTSSTTASTATSISTAPRVTTASTTKSLDCSTKSTMITGATSMNSTNSMLPSSSSSSGSQSPPTMLLLNSAMKNTLNAALSSSLSSSSSSSTLMPVTSRSTITNNYYHSNGVGRSRANKKVSVSPTISYPKAHHQSLQNLKSRDDHHCNNNTDDNISLNGIITETNPNDNRLLTASMNNNIHSTHNSHNTHDNHSTNANHTRSYNDVQANLKKHFLNGNMNGKEISEFSRSFIPSSTTSPQQLQSIQQEEHISLKRLRTIQNCIHNDCDNDVALTIGINNGKNSLATVTNTASSSRITSTVKNANNNSLPFSNNKALTTQTTNIGGYRTATASPEDDDYYYLLSLYPYMKQMTAAQKLRTRTKFQKIILKQLYKDDVKRQSK